MISMVFESKLSQPKDQIWKWMTSVEGISAELWPLLRMTTPRGVHNLADLNFKSGRRLFRSYLLLFGFLPIDYSDLTLVEFNSDGFIEQSPMGFIKFWRHERFLEVRESNPSQVFLVDKLTFEPLIAQNFAKWFTRKLFEHRHVVLRRRFG